MQEALDAVLEAQPSGAINQSDFAGIVNSGLIRGDGVAFAAAVRRPPVMVGAQIYRPSVPEGFEWSAPSANEDFEVLRRLGERRPNDPWTPIHMTLLKTDDEGRAQEHADMPWLGSHALVLRDRAIETVGQVLEPHGELLPLRCDDARLAVFSAPLVTGVLDEAASDVVRFGAGRIMALRAPVFRARTLGDREAFKLTELPRGDLYLTAELVRAIRGTGLAAGTDFELVYEGGSDL